MPSMFLAMYWLWWKAALTPKEPHVIVLMPEDDAPELSMTAPSVMTYQG